MGTILAGALTLSGCSIENKRYPYYYRGQIGENYVTFTEKKWSVPFNENNNYLTIKKLNGKEIEYIDYDSDLKVDCVVLHVNGKKIRWYGKWHDDDITPEVNSAVLSEGQKQFDAYLPIILQAKKQQQESEGQARTQAQQDSIRQALDNLK